ncbi:MAG: hypothetical protein HY699_12030 [Deltaproteobacteria bacterium]|nr:hypothetical protein [Deltaproteobacteria bacterium]
MQVRVIAGVVAGLVVVAGAGEARGGQVITEERVAQQVVVRDLRVRAGAVSGLVVNNARKPLRDVRLLIRHQWIWKNERNPGPDNPGRVAYYTVHEEIPPDVSVAFKYRPNPPLPDRSDGHFETTVEVVGYSEVGE